MGKIQLLSAKMPQTIVGNAGILFQGKSLANTGIIFEEKLWQMPVLYLKMKNAKVVKTFFSYKRGLSVAFAKAG